MAEKGEGQGEDELADEADEPLVTVYATDMQSRVAVLRMALEDAEIPFLAKNAEVSTFFPVDGMAVVDFQVRERDAERARAVIQELGLR